jgi:hypothetical protein
VLVRCPFYLARATHDLVLSYGSVRWHFSVGPEDDQYCDRRIGAHAAALAEGGTLAGIQALGIYPISTGPHSSAHGILRRAPALTISTIGLADVRACRE